MNTSQIMYIKHEHLTNNIYNLNTSQITYINMNTSQITYIKHEHLTNNVYKT